MNSPRFTDLSVLNDLLVELESDPALRCLVLSAEGEPGFVPAADTPWVAWQERPEFKEGLSDPGYEAWGTEVGASVAWEARSRWKWSV